MTQSSNASSQVNERGREEKDRASHTDILILHCTSLPLHISDSLSSGKEAEKDIEEHFAKCMNALAERKAVLLREAANKVTSQSMLHIIFLILPFLFSLFHKFTHI